jgi:putative tricarboxylic transport membrane protein
MKSEAAKRDEATRPEANSTRSATHRDWPGAVAAVACILVAVFVLYETERYTTFGAIFPRTVAIVMIVVGLILIGRIVAGLPPTPVTPLQSLWRPLALIGVGALWAALIGLIGFYPASVIGFIGAGLLAQFEPWTPRALAVFLTLSVLIASVGYFIFAYLLNIPFD